MGVDELVTGGSVTDPDVDSLTTDGVDYNSLTPDYPIVTFSGMEDSADQTTTSVTYVSISVMQGAADLGDRPTNSTLYGRFYGALKNSGASNTTYARPQVSDNDGVGTVDLTELEVSATGTSFSFVDSGWQEITSGTLNRIRRPIIRGKVDAGTGTYFSGDWALAFAGVESVA